MITKQQVTVLWERFTETAQALHANGSIRTATPEARRKFQEARDCLNSAQEQARKEFADARGWKVSKKTARIDQPEVDHAELFILPGERIPRVMVTHSYASRQQLAEYAARNGYRVEFLPWSWYWPPKALAAVFIPGDET